MVEQKAGAELFPSLGMDESYTLTLASPRATLRAKQVWGAVRGLETFSQLLAMNGPGHAIRGGAAGMVIADAPRFPWRGLMMDPARHFIRVGELNRTIDASEWWMGVVSVRKQVSWWASFSVDGCICSLLYWP